MQLVVNDLEAVAPVTLRPKRMNDDKFLALCAQYPDFRLERKANGKIVIMPPCGGETGFRNIQLSTQLNVWALKTGHGWALDSSTGFVLADRSIMGPDASWVSKARLAKLTKRQQEQFLSLCPEFVVELTSPSDRLKAVQAKMLDWMNNGALLGWLLDPGHRTAYIYRPGQPPEKIVAPAQLIGEGPVEGFVLDLTEIWAGFSDIS